MYTKKRSKRQSCSAAIPRKFVKVSGTPAVRKISEGEVITRSSHETACQVILERGARAGHSGYKKVSWLTPRVLGPNSKKLWLIKQTSYYTKDFASLLPKW